MEFKTYLKTNTGITDESFKYFESELVYKKVTKGVSLLASGQKCQSFYYVEKGLLRFFSIDSNGKEHIIQFAQEQGFISDRASFFFDEPSGYYIDAIEDTYIVSISFSVMEKIGTYIPNFNQFNGKILNRHIMSLQNRINLLISATAEERYLQFMNQYPALLMRVPQWMIASYLGITPESLSRVRKELAFKHRKMS